MNWLFAGGLFRLGSKSPQYVSYVTRREGCHRGLNNVLHVHSKQKFAWFDQNLIRDIKKSEKKPVSKISRIFILHNQLLLPEIQRTPGIYFIRNPV